MTPLCTLQWTAISTLTHFHSSSTVRGNQNWCCRSQLLTSSSSDCTQVKGNCLECLSVSRPMCKWCATGSCGYSCQSELQTCPCKCHSYFIMLCSPLTLLSAFSAVVPDHGYIGGGETVVIRGGPFPSKGDSGEDLIYSCIFASVAGPGLPSADGQSLTCTTPLRGNLIGNVSLSVNVGAQPYIPWDSLNFLFYGTFTLLLSYIWSNQCIYSSDCLTLSDRSCSDQCLQQRFCGWCATKSSCVRVSRHYPWVLLTSLCT